ncbi:MAG: DUF4364 family protein [Acutalibacter sp.]
MKQDAFSAGVEPGGLWHKNDIRILLCYPGKLGAPLRQDLPHHPGKGLASRGWRCPGQLLKQGNITQDEQGFCAVTRGGLEIANSLDATLPLSVRDKALEAAFTLLAQAKAQRENRVELQKIKQGYQVTCHISGGDMDLMAVTLYVPDRAQAEMVKRSFYKDPAGVYKLVLASLTKDTSLAREYFIERQEQL